MKRTHGGQFAEDGLYHPSLNPDPSTVDDSDFRKPSVLTGLNVFLHHFRNFLGAKRVKIERILQWDSYRLLFLWFRIFGCFKKRAHSRSLCPSFSVRAYRPSYYFRCYNAP